MKIQDIFVATLGISVVIYFIPAVLYKLLGGKLWDLVLNTTYLGFWGILSTVLAGIIIIKMYNPLKMNDLEESSQPH